MEIYKIVPQDFSANSYILTQDNAEAVVIDPSCGEVLSALKERNLVCKYALLTHAHFDHVGACGVLFQSGTEIICGEEEKDFIFSEANLGIFGGVYIPHFKVARTVKDGQNFTLCGINFTAIRTAGHTAGSYIYLADGALFSGDTLFAGSIGRTDLPTGDYSVMRQSLKKLVSIDKDLKVYPGHGENTTLKDEKNFNPYLR